MADLGYLTSVLKARILGPTDQRCPYCGRSDSTVVGRKFWLLELRKCSTCGLMFRYPKESLRSSESYYQRDYSEGLTTQTPTLLELRAMTENGFAGTTKDFSQKIGMIAAYAMGGVALDYGCSWGYGVWQLNRAGFDAMGFEISRPRAEFGRRELGVKVIEDALVIEQQSDEKFDLIFTSHVLEHLPDISQVFSVFYRCLRPDGVLAIFVPDCDGCDYSEVLARKKTFAFGQKHATALDSTFLRYALTRAGFAIEMIGPNSSSEFPELAVIARKRAAE